MFSMMNKTKFDSISFNRITYNWHLYSILMKTFLNMPGVRENFHVLTKSKGQSSRTTNQEAASEDEFISSIQHTTLPWSGLQFHPEKPLFEIYPQKQQPGIVSNHEVALLSQAISNKFVEQCRTLNDRRISEQDLINLSI